MTTPALVSLFALHFPPWSGTNDEVDASGMYPTPSGGSVIARFVPRGVCGLDKDGAVWVLVEDYSIGGFLPGSRLRWARFEAPMVAL